MIPHMVLEYLSHERINRPAASGQRMQRPLAIDVLGEELLNRRDLPAYALDAINQLLLLAHGVRHAEWYTW